MYKKALITGITGQDAAYLTQFLIHKNYFVYGAYRRSSSLSFWRLEDLNLQYHPNLKLIECDILDFSAVTRAIQEIQPNEIYNLAAQSFVSESFSHPTKTYEINSVGVLNILEAIRLLNKNIKFYQASTSEMYGNVSEIPQTEDTSFHPKSPYGVSKLYAYWMTVNYRDNYNIFAVNGILFNHESPLRGPEFVTRKITSNIAKIKAGKIDSFELGNLDSRRDWGFAKEYIEGMWMMLQAEMPDDFILATGESYSIRDFLSLAFNYAEIDIQFEGSNEEELVLNKKNGDILVKINPDYYRPGEVNFLLGDYTKVKRILNWEPKIKLPELCRLMINEDIKRYSSKI
jgi:GDPmannose 4,6-dehydratase